MERLNSLGMSMPIELWPAGGCVRDLEVLEARVGELDASAPAMPMRGAVVDQVRPVAGRSPWSVVRWSTTFLAISSSVATS